MKFNTKINKSNITNTNDINNNVQCITCNICTENIDKNKNNIIILKCGHEYHNNCITEWFNVIEDQPNIYTFGRNCPYCRKRV